MRPRTAVIVSLALLTTGVGLAAGSRTQPGPLVGQTQISYGCPGPARIGHPSCEIWHPFHIMPGSPSDRSARQDNRFRRSSGLSSPTVWAASPFGSARATTRSRRWFKLIRPAARN